MQVFKSLAVLGLLFATQVSAHGLWTEQRRGNIEVIYGHGAEDNVFKAQKISGAWAYDASGKMIPVTVERLSDHARLKPLKSPAVLAGGPGERRGGRAAGFGAAAFPPSR